TQPPSQNVPSSAAMQQAAAPPAASPPVEPERPEALQDRARSEESAQKGRDRVAPERPAGTLRTERAAQTLAPAPAKLLPDGAADDGPAASQARPRRRGGCQEIDNWSGVGKRS